MNSPKPLRRLLALACLFAFGCQTKTAEQATPSQQQTKSDDAVKASKKAPTGTETKGELDDQTLFRAVLAGGYRVRPAAQSDDYHAYCKASYETLVKRGEEVRPFLEKKLLEGRIAEQPLAIHLLGALGKSGQPSGRHLVSTISRSWEVAMQRCVAKSRGVQVAGRPLEPTAEEAAQCANKVQGSRPPTSVKMACDALRRMGPGVSVKRLFSAEMGGHFIRPCTPYLLSGDLESAHLLRFITRELDGKPNGKLCWDGLLSRGADGVGALSKILEARARSGKVYEEPRCLFSRFVEAYRARGGDLASLAGDVQERLQQLASGKLADGTAVPESVQRCAQFSTKILKMPGAKPSRMQGANASTPALALAHHADGPFCPSKRADQ